MNESIIEEVEYLAHVSLYKHPRSVPGWSVCCYDHDDTDITLRLSHTSFPAAQGSIMFQINVGVFCDESVIPGVVWDVLRTHMGNEIAFVDGFAQWFPFFSTELTLADVTGLVYRKILEPVPIADAIAANAVEFMEAYNAFLVQTMQKGCLADSSGWCGYVGSDHERILLRLTRDAIAIKTKTITIDLTGGDNGYINN